VLFFSFASETFPAFYHPETGRAGINPSKKSLWDIQEVDTKPEEHHLWPTSEPVSEFATHAAAFDFPDPGACSQPASVVE
jgi:hypothetical protein